jgi:hypothetical protein
MPNSFVSHYPFHPRLTQPKTVRLHKKGNKLVTEAPFPAPLLFGFYQGS